VSEGPPEAPRLTDEEAATIGRRLRWGLGLTVAGVVAGGVLGRLNLLDTLALPAFLVLLPALGLAQLPLLGKERLERMAVYLGSGITILIMGAVALLLGNRGIGLAAMAVAPVAPGVLLGWTVGITAGGLVLALLTKPVERHFSGGPPQLLLHLLPRTTQEKATFAGLSLAAGWGEELVYRGYVPALLVVMGMDLWPALGVSAVSFGLLHAYQGSIGIMRTSVMGLLLALPVAWSGSLFPAMAAHALYDVVAGLVLGPRLLGSPPSDTDN
jgi:membrane protease YdiL (CAAX protease family)